MRTKQLLIALCALALLAGACANSPTETSAPSSAPSSVNVSAAPSVSGSASGSVPEPSSVAPSASTGTCRPEAPTATSADWSTLRAHDGDYSFKFPATWDKIYGSFVFTPGQLIDSQTFAETGLPANHPTRADLVRLPVVGLPNAGVLIVPGVVSSTATVFARQVDRFNAIADIKMISTNLVACIGGAQALGAAFTFSKDTRYQESWYVVRGGRSYDLQWLAMKGQEQTATFREMFRTWQWAPNVPVATPLPATSALPPTAAPTSAPTEAPSSVPTAAPSSVPTVTPTGSGGSSSFVLAGMATRVDTAGTAANPQDFVTTIPKEATTIYAVFSMKKGLTGQVNGSLKQGDRVVVSLSLQYSAKNTWGDFRINSASGIAAGDYTMVITFVPTGETINLPFTVK